MLNPRNDNAPGEGREVGIQDNIDRNEFSYPDPSSVKGRVLGALLAGETLTHWDCWRRFGSARLAHHVYVLRGIGWPVQIEERTVTTSDGGRPALVGFYRLDADTIAAAGERGRAFTADCHRANSERRAG